MCSFTTARPVSLFNAILLLQVVAVLVVVVWCVDESNGICGAEH